MYVSTCPLPLLFRSRREKSQAAHKRFCQVFYVLIALQSYIAPLHYRRRSLRAPSLIRRAQRRSTSNRAIVYPSAAPTKTSDGKCARFVTRERLIAVAHPYATNGTHR